MSAIFAKMGISFPLSPLYFPFPLPDYLVAFSALKRGLFQVFKATFQLNTSSELGLEKTVLWLRCWYYWVFYVFSEKSERFWICIIRSWWLTHIPKKIILIFTVTVQIKKTWNMESHTVFCQGTWWRY